MTNCPFLTSSHRGVAQTLPSQLVDDEVRVVTGWLFLVGTVFDGAGPPEERELLLGNEDEKLLEDLFVLLIDCGCIAGSIVGVLYVTTSCVSGLTHRYSLQEDCSYDPFKVPSVHTLLCTLQVPGSSDLCAYAMIESPCDTVVPRGLTQFS